MSRNISDNFRDEKNKIESSATINLYDIVLDNTNTVHFCDWDKDVTFGGINYIAFPITRSDINQDVSGKVTSIAISIANVNRTMSSYLEMYNGLVGNKVTIKTVFADLLNDPDSYVSEEFYIKTSFADEKSVTLNASSKLDILSIKIPKRKFYRNFCQWEYKKTGCWLATGATFEAPSGFSNTGASCDHTLDGPSGCEWHNNEKRFGGFPGVPKSIDIIRI